MTKPLDKTGGHFALRKPCVTCPFRLGQGELFGLSEERLREIVTAPSFQCHKTVDYDGEAPSPGTHPRQCAGLCALLHRENAPNQMMQVAERLGGVDFDTFDASEVYQSFEDAFVAHGRGRR